MFFIVRICKVGPSPGATAAVPVGGSWDLYILSSKVAYWVARSMRLLDPQEAAIRQ